jgi:hypothetical protein
MLEDSIPMGIKGISDQQRCMSTNTQSSSSPSISAWVDEMTERTKGTGDDQSITDSDPSTALSDPFTSTAPKVPEDALQFDLTTQRIGESDRYLQFRFFWNGLDGNCDEHIQVRHHCPHLEALKRNPSAWENPPAYRYLGERRGNVLPIAFRYTLVDGKASDYEAIQWNDGAESLYANFTAKTRNLRIA